MRKYLENDDEEENREQVGKEGKREEHTTTNFTFLLTSFPLLDMWMMSWSENMRALCVSSRQCPHSTWPAGGASERSEEEEEDRKTRGRGVN